MAKVAGRPILNLLHGLAIAAVQQAVSGSYARTLALALLADFGEGPQRIVGKLASSLSQFPLLLRGCDDDG